MNQFTKDAKSGLLLIYIIVLIQSFVNLFIYFLKIILFLVVIIISFTDQFDAFIYAIRSCLTNENSLISDKHLYWGMIILYTYCNALNKYLKFWFLSNNLLKVIIGNFLQNSFKTSTAPYFLLLDFGSLSESMSITLWGMESTASAVFLPPASARIPRHSAAFSTNV